MGHEMTGRSESGSVEQQAGVATRTTALPAHLVRDLSVTQATSVVVGTIIGTGIFLVPKEMMEAVGSARLVYLAWVVGGLLSFFGALTYAELGTMKPEAGGEYVYMRDGYGPLGGFLYAWTTFLISKPGSIATVTAGIVRILGTFSALSFLSRPLVTLSSRLVVTSGHLVGIGLIVFISGVNYIGVKKAGNFQVFFTVLKIVIVLAVICIGFSYADGSWSNFATRFTGAHGGFAGFMVALVAALWAYDGWNNLNMVAGEMRRPERNVPIALIGGVATCTIVYVLFNAAVQYVMPASVIASSGRPGSDVVLLVLGVGAATTFAAAMALQMLATLNAATMSGARVPFATARDGYFIKALAEVHPRFHTPSVSLAFQAVLAAIMLLFVGSFQQLFSLTLFAEWLFYMLTASTVFIFRRTQPDAVRPYKTWGYPVLPALFIAASAVLLVYTFKADVWNSIIGVGVILAGVPVFYFFARKRSQSA
jgi:APA family basic amino acid/polyamine antiporter